MAAIGVGPSNCALAVAHHVTGAAFKTILVVKQNATVAHWHEEVGRATRHTRFSCARAANFIVDRNVGSSTDSELDRRHAVFKADPIVGSNTHGGPVYDEAGAVLTATVSKPMPPRGRWVRVTVTL